MAQKYWDHLKLKNGDSVKFVPPAPDGDKLGGITVAEKEKLDGLESGATKTVVDSQLSQTSTNPVQNKTVSKKLTEIGADISELDEKKQDTISVKSLHEIGASLVTQNVVEAVGIPEYVSEADLPNYSQFGITTTGWYVFARVTAKDHLTVSSGFSISGADGYIMPSAGDDFVDIAVRFDAASQSKAVTINWGDVTETYIFKATDLAVRNLDYRTTFYIYDIAPYTSWEYTLTQDTAFVSGTNYYTKNGDEYEEATVTEGDAVTADTYYVHSKAIFSGMTKNITYKCDTIIDCPIEFKLPDVNDDGYGAWFEVQFRHNGTYSTTLTPASEDVKISSSYVTGQTQGINVIDLHYTAVGGSKVWTMLNTHSDFT